MKTLLEFYLRHLEFLYLDPRYRITNSRTTGVATNNAWLTLTGPVLSWSITNDRGQILFDVAPTARADSGDSCFRISLVRQFMDGVDETTPVSVDATVFWIRKTAVLQPITGHLIVMRSRAHATTPPRVVAFSCSDSHRSSSATL